MNNVVQFNQPELETLIAEKLSGNGLKVIPAEYTITFVTDAEGKTSALVTGVVEDPDANVQEPEPDTGLTRTVRVALRLLLTNRPQKKPLLVTKVLNHLEPSGRENQSVVEGIVTEALQEWAQTGSVVYVDDIDAWHRVRAPKTTASSAAADVLNGSGGAAGRGDALGAGITGS